MSDGKISFWSPTSLICTCIVGKLPWAPGTMGSLFAFPLLFVYFYLWMLIPDWMGYTRSEIPLYFDQIIVPVSFVLLTFFLGWHFTNKYIAATGREDPKEVVIDEVCGQAIALFLSIWIIFSFFYSPQGWGGGYHSLVMIFQLSLLSFVNFRLFDIVKRGPVGWLDRNVKGGLGVMLDDVVAGILAGITSALIFLVL